MKIRNGKMRFSTLALAVQGALVAMCAMSAQAEDDLTALTMPTNFVEIGVSNTSDSSQKYGEYNGLNKSGSDLIGNFSVQGGDAYGKANGTTRWVLEGSDLGTTSRALGATISNQGQWSLGIGYDELRHNTGDGYKTPYVNGVGASTFTLPAGYGSSASSVALTQAQRDAFQTVEIGTNRKNTSLAAGLNLGPQWDIKLDFNHLDQSGAKLMGFPEMNHGGAVSQGAVILPNPTNYKTDTVNLAVNWKGDQSHASGSYFGSFFRNGSDRLTFTTPLGANDVQTLSTAPANQFHQLNLSGGYALAPKTKLTGGLSYARNTQNDPDAFVVDSFMMVTPSPKSSMNGLVVTTHGDLKLTDQTTKDLTLSAGLKYDKRENRTDAAIYNFEAINATAGDRGNYSNTPLSNKKIQLELAGDYRLTKDQRVRLAYNRENISRWCEHWAGNATSGAIVGAGGNCVTGTGSKEDKLSATYKLKATQDVDLTAGYAFSRRRAEFDQYAVTAFFTIPPEGTAGRNSGDPVGFHPYYEASRLQQALKGGANWQATDKLSVGVSGRYTDDRYDNLYGVKDGNGVSLNLDATYNYSDNGSFSSYLTQQHKKRELTNWQASTTATATRLAVPGGATWTNTLKDDDLTIGLGVKQGGLMGGKLDLAGDFTYSVGTTRYETQHNYVGLNNAGLTCDNVAFLSCGDLPEIRNSMTQFKLVGTYSVDKSSKFALGYAFQRLRSSDYFYSGTSYGNTPNAVLSSDEKPGSYSVSVITARYIYSFK